MSASYTILHQIVDVSGNQTNLCRETVTATTALQADFSIPGTTTNLLVAFPNLTQANLIAVALFVSPGGTLTLKTNSTGSPQDTIILTGASASLGQVLLWTLQTNLIGKCPFAGNTTALYLTNGGASAATFSIRVLTN